MMWWLLVAVPLSLTPFCDGFRLAPDSPAIDAGEWIAEIHCPTAGYNNSGCVEWFGDAPDIGACEYIPEQALDAPTNLEVQPNAS